MSPTVTKSPNRSASLSLCGGNVHPTLEPGRPRSALHPFEDAPLNAWLSLVRVAADDFAAGHGRQLLVNTDLRARGEGEDAVDLGHADGITGGRIVLPTTDRIFDEVDRAVGKPEVCPARVVARGRREPGRDPLHSDVGATFLKGLIGKSE